MVDAVVPVVIAFWTLVAPATDDDGYYAAMARNARVSGEVGNYYQLFDQNFTPFTWFYYVLGRWQGLVGDAPVLQRLLAVAFGLLTWMPPAPVRRRRDGRHRRRAAGRAFGVPRDPGRDVPGVVAAAGHGGAARGRGVRVRDRHVVRRAGGGAPQADGRGVARVRRRRPGLRRPPDRVHAARAAGGRAAAAVAAGGGAGRPGGDGRARVGRGVRRDGRPAAAFVDGGLRDFLRGQAIFLSIQAQENWTTEIQRYAFLLTADAMGNYAKRAAVLLCLVALVWFGVLAAAARMRRVPLPTALWLAGSTRRWPSRRCGSRRRSGPTTSGRWPASARRSSRCSWRWRCRRCAACWGRGGCRTGWSPPRPGRSSSRSRWGGTGRTCGPTRDLDGVRRPGFPPAISRVVLDSPLLWLGVLAVVVVALVVSGRVVGTRDARLNVLRAVPILAVISLVGTTVYTVGTFGLAAVQGVPRASLWAQGLADPTAQRCAAAGATEVLDPYTAVPLAEAAGLPAPSARDRVRRERGYYPGNRPQGAAARRVWGSLVATDGGSAGPDRRTR